MGSQVGKMRWYGELEKVDGCGRERRGGGLRKRGRQRMRMKRGLTVCDYGRLMRDREFEL